MPLTLSECSGHTVICLEMSTVLRMRSPGVGPYKAQEACVSTEAQIENELMLVPRVLTSTPSGLGCVCGEEREGCEDSSEDTGVGVGTQTLFLQPKLELRGSSWSREKGG